PRYAGLPLLQSVSSQSASSILLDSDRDVSELRYGERQRPAHLADHGTRSVSDPRISQITI
ncbi:MAG TPA: hypothetical protein VGL29_12045, partial [Blastocatellia bacterium]